MTWTDAGSLDPDPPFITIVLVLALLTWTAQIWLRTLGF